MKTSTDCRSFVTICKAFLFTLLLSAGMLASANAQTLVSDHWDYAPGDVATLTGTGFQPGETVTVQVVNADGSPNSNDAPFYATADANGNFVTTWIVPADSSALHQVLLATADGQLSGFHAECTFTDASTFDTIDFHQASNQDHPTVPISWINGILNPNNSDYTEGMGVPQRIILTGIVATSTDTHSLTLRHQAIKGGIHAYDFIISWQQSVEAAAALLNFPVNELQNLFAQKCTTAISSAGLDACNNTINHITADVPDNMSTGNPSIDVDGTPVVATEPQPAVAPALSVNGAIQCFEGLYATSNRVVDLYGNATFDWATLTFNGYDIGTNDAYALYTLKWKSASDKVVILLAGHTAQSCTSSGCCGYGSGHGSGSVSGGPYHFKLDDFDGHTTGSQDNQLQANAVSTVVTCDSVDITGTSPVCPHSTSNVYTTTVHGGCSNITHHWSVSGEGSISGSATNGSVTIIADSCGSFTICDTITCDEGQVVCCRTIMVTDNTAPVITCPSVSNVECPASPSFGAASASDDCDSSPSITASNVTTSGNCAAEYSVTRTWTATDECGNSSTCSRTISVNDNTAPVLTCPTVSNVECPASPSFGAASASDACDASPVITNSEVTTPGACPQEFSITRTWTATDECGNASTCSRTISVTDNTAPVISCPTISSPVECPASPSFGAASATDACDPTPTISASNVTTPGNCPQEFSVTRTWTATDHCGNASTCSRTIAVEDNTAPVISCPTVSDVECPNTPNFGVATATDACDPTPTITNSNVTTSGNCPFTVTRTWTATDHCGNASTCSRTISVSDNTPPTISCPTVSNVECPASPSFGVASATDVCDANVDITNSNVTTPGACPQEFSITRTWTATDDCGNSSTCSRTISVSDNTAPVITCPTVSNVECPASPSFGAASATDACDPTPTVTNSNVTTPGACPQEFSITRTWTATDHCGNASTCSRTINVTDNTAPVLTCPTVSNVECPASPSFGAASATDACDPTPTVTNSNVTTPGACPQEFSITRTWTATDHCGNASTCSRTINVTDNTAPVITCPTVSSPVECPASPSFGAASATDACDPTPTVTNSNVTTPGACPQEFSVTRTWTATDHCGNASTCSRTISVTDDTAPVITCPTVSSPVSCPASPSFGAASATDACDPTPTVTNSNVTTPGACPQEFSVTRTWTATDHCGNASTCSRTIAVEDNTAPVITCPTVSSPIECPASPSFGAASATDACDPTPTISASNVTTNGSCAAEYSVTRTWTATDHCGNASTCSRTISVEDNTPPTITCAAGDTVDCGDDIQFTPPTASDLCDASVDVTVTVNEDVTMNSDGSSEHCRTWQATDDCGNHSECTQCIHVGACSQDLFCSYTQGFWGNAGGHDCSGADKLTLINQLLSTPLVIGCGGNTMTFGVGEGQCVIDRLPGGGPSAVITGANTCNSIVGIALHSGNPARFRNVLLAQTIALELNVRYSTGLGNVQITGQYMTTMDATPCDTPNAVPTGSPSTHTISQTVINYLGANNTVDDLLALANQALCGALVPGPGVPTLSDINGAVDAFNEGFDECRFLIGFSNTLRAGAVADNASSAAGTTAAIAYPNPFNSSTNITFSVSQSSDNVKVEVFNAVGERVAMPFHGAVEAGVMYTVEFNAADMPAGIYTYRILSGNESYIDKLTLIK